jgi:hypothetical protein
MDFNTERSGRGSVVIWVNMYLRLYSMGAVQQDGKSKLVELEGHKVVE